MYDGEFKFVVVCCLVFIGVEFDKRFKYVFMCICFNVGVVIFNY